MQGGRRRRRSNKTNATLVSGHRARRDAQGDNVDYGYVACEEKEQG
jgi:hypothetical protein